MNNINNYRKRFFNLLESEMGNVKPLISEDFDFTTGQDKKIDTTPKETADSLYQKYGKKIKLWQKMLVLLGQNLGNTGENKDGVDGAWGNKSKTGVKNLCGNSAISLENFKKLYSMIQLDKNKMAKLNEYIDKIKSSTGTKKTTDKKTTDKNKVKTDTDKVVKSTGKGFVIPFAFPDYQPKIDGNGQMDKFIGWASRTLTGGGKEGTYGKLGHAGVSVVDTSGKIYTFEFGRYKDANLGVTLASYPNVVAKFDSNGKISNIEAVIKGIRMRTQGDGPRQKISYAVLSAPNPTNAISYGNTAVKSKGKDYQALDFSISDDDANCGTFAQEVVKAAGANVSEMCYPTPTAMVSYMSGISEDEGLQSGTIA